MSCWDTSCLVKLYTPEPDSALFRMHAAGQGTCVTCDLAPLEFWATVRRKETEGVLAAGEAERVQAALETDLAAGMIAVVACDGPVREKYRSPVNQCHVRTPAITIRTNDALHLAAASCTGEMEIVATDKRLREATLFLGFTVFPAST